MVAKLEKWQVAVGYVRSSGVGDNVRLSLFSQELGIQQCADGFGVLVRDWYVDEGSSGRSMERAGLQRLLAAAKPSSSGMLSPGPVAANMRFACPGLINHSGKTQLIGLQSEPTRLSLRFRPGPAWKC